MIDRLKKVFPDVVPKADFVALRYESEQNESLGVRQGVVEPVSTTQNVGVMLTVADGGGLGYAATSDLSRPGLREAGRRALAWAQRSAGRSVTNFSNLDHGCATGSYETPVLQPWIRTSLRDKLDLLRRHCDELKGDDRIVDWWTRLTHIDAQTLYVNTNGAEVEQHFQFLIPAMGVAANAGSETIVRTLHGHGAARQGGLEVLERVGFPSAAPRIAEEAIELLTAPNCPTGTMDVVLAPDQMILQIHESIGHPLELDRILGDERNYAGTSFVTLDMFGSYRYGSELLNVVWDPMRPEQLGTYAFDDEGRPAQFEYIIREGVLERPLGGASSQARAGMKGVSTSRASGWNRPPIDRMANLNLEPGELSLDDLIGGVERGVFMATNNSWSIDDSRNKFQFGCEYARVIEDGELKHVVRKSNYRGISATFWRNLTGVGNDDTFEVLGTPHCGKGEPNQLIRVGHASPACRFSEVEVFGGV